MKDARKYKECAMCGKELDETFFMYRDNFLQIKYFEEDDGHDNAFCSIECASDALGLVVTQNVKKNLGRIIK